VPHLERCARAFAYGGLWIAAPHVDGRATCALIRPSMKGTVHEYELMIHEAHLDTFGHVNNAKYLEVLEEARWDFITRNGYGLDEVIRTRIGPTILEINLRFQREIRNRQRITIRSWTDSYKGKIAKFVQQVVDQDGNVLCEAVFTIGLFDLNARKLILPTPEWLKAIGIDSVD
jgi:acyl-CoA thioester hydrolase